MPVAMEQRSLQEQALEVLRRAGNPFRNYFARNPDDEVCARYHVAELFARERDQLLGVVDLYRFEPTTHSEVVPILGNKGSGKTHLLHSIKHSSEGAWQLLVTPGTYQKDSDFLEYLLFQLIDTLLGGGKQRGLRPLDFVGEEISRRLMHKALTSLTPPQQLALFPPSALIRLARMLGLGGTQAQERTQWLLDLLARPTTTHSRATESLKRICSEAGLDPQRALDCAWEHIDRTEVHNTAGLMRRHLQRGFLRAALLGDEEELANFLTFGFAELDFKVRPSRQDLVLALFKVLMENFLRLKIPVVVAFDQLEDLLLARRADDGHRIAECFFAGIVQAMHQVEGLCFLIFAERGLWNRFVPSLDGYIQDRLNNPVHLPRHGTIKTLRLEAPAPDLVRQVVAARLRPALEDLSNAADLPPLFPFQEDQVVRVARTEPTLRDMLQQFRHLFDHLVYGESLSGVAETNGPEKRGGQSAEHPSKSGPTRPGEANRLPPEPLPAHVKSMMVVESSSAAPALPPSGPQMLELWDQEMRAARRQLEPEGSLTGATRELQAGLGTFLQTCHEHGAKVGPWRLHHVVGELTFGEHPTYGVVTIAHWVCKDGQPWKVGIGLFLGRGPGKPKDLEIKLASMEAAPPVIDHLILLRPEDDLTLSGKSKSLWQEAQKKGQHARLEAVSLDIFAILYGFPRWLTAVSEAMPEGQPLPNLADLLQDRCEKLLEQICMPVQA